MKTLYYQHHDADHSLDVPAEAFGGWKTGEVDIDLSHTALVVMHAWDPGTLETHSAWWRTVEYLPRAKKILEEEFPPLLTAVRNSPMKVFHVWSGREKSYKPLDIGHRSSSIEHRASMPEASDTNNNAVSSRRSQDLPRRGLLSAWRQNHVFVGEHNIVEVNRCLDDLDIAPQAKPHPGEGVAIDGDQLFALCQENGIDHLIYVGFAINWCLLMSPGGMVDMSRHGIICSTIPEAVTAVENKETAREEREKQQALWRVSLEFGFVFPNRELVAVVKNC